MHIIVRGNKNTGSGFVKYVSCYLSSLPRVQPFSALLPYVKSFYLMGAIPLLTVLFFSRFKDSSSAVTIDRRVVVAFQHLAGGRYHSTAWCSRMEVRSSTDEAMNTFYMSS
jgi:hypothetical protein